MPRSYPAEFRRKVLDRVEPGRPVAEIAEQLGVTGSDVLLLAQPGLGGPRAMPIAFAIREHLASMTS